MLPVSPPFASTIAPAIASHVVGAFELLVLACAVGATAAYLLYWSSLRWTWAVPGMAVAVLAWPADKPIGAALSVASLTAARLGWRWHRRDVFAGGDVAAAAASRRGVLATLRTAQRQIAPAREAPVDDAGLLVGHDGDRNAVRIPLAGARGATHTLIVGATGSGKTVTQTWILLRCLEQGMGAVVVDPKGDALLAGELRRRADALGRRFIVWSATGPTTYNPLARGSETEIVDKALAGERFTEPHYLRQAQRYLGHAVRVLRAAGRTPSLATLVASLDPGWLEQLARQAPDAVAEPTFAYLDALTARQVRDLAGVRDRLAVLAESDAARWLSGPDDADDATGRHTDGTQTHDDTHSHDDPHNDTHNDDGTHAAEHTHDDPPPEPLDLLTSLRRGDAVYFALEADRRPLLAAMLGAAIVQDLITVVAACQADPLHAVVAIDEFAALAADQVARLFGRARSAGLSLLLATQELADLRPPGRTALLDQVLGNLSALIVHRQVVPDSAALIATIAGTRAGWSGAVRPDGEVTRTRTRELALHPDRIRALGTGEAAVIVPGDEPRVARILSPAAG